MGHINLARILQAERAGCRLCQANIVAQHGDPENFRGYGHHCNFHHIQNFGVPRGALSEICRLLSSDTAISFKNSLRHACLTHRVGRLWVPLSCNYASKPNGSLNIIELIAVLSIRHKRGENLEQAGI